MRFLIAGLGSAGRRHLRNLIALGERDIVLYRTGRSTLPDDELAGFPVETRLEAALERRPDAVIVANPTAMHLDVAIPAAQAGCHLLIEKPVSHSMDRIHELEAAVAAANVRVLIGFQYRFHPALQAIRRWVDEARPGAPLFARAHYGDYLPGWHPWEDFRAAYSARREMGGGALLTLCHPIDYLAWMFGVPTLEWADARRAPHLEIEVEAIVELGLSFAGGALAAIHLDFVQRPSDHHLEIIGTEGTVRWSQADGAAYLFRDDRRPSQTVQPPAGFERNDMFLAEMQHFRAVCRGEAAPACTLEDGRRCLEVIEAARAYTVRPEGLR